MKKLLTTLLALSLLLVGCGRKMPSETAPLPTVSVTQSIPASPEDVLLPTPVTITEQYRYVASLAEDGTPAMLYAGSDPEALRPYLFNELRSLRRELSSAEETGDIFRLNNTHGLNERLTDRQASMVQLGLTLSEQTGGAFDLTDEPLRLLWDPEEHPLLPADSEIAAARALCDYRTILLTDNSLSFESLETMLNTEAYLDGYCIDVLATAVEEAGVSSAKLTIDSTSYYLETSVDAAAAVSLHYYRQDGEYPVCTLYCRNYAISEAHCELYTRTVDDVSVHPYYDLRTGRPSEQGYVSVFVLSPSAALAQITAKACYSRSPEEGNTMLSEIPDTYAIYVLKDGSIYCTDGLTDRFAVSFANR